MTNKLFNQARNCFYNYHINQAKACRDKSLLVGKSPLDDGYVYKFLFPLRGVITGIFILNNNLEDYSCTCDEFKHQRSCMHIPYILLNNSDKLDIKDENYIKKKSKSILNMFAKNDASGVIKKELNLELTLVIYESYWGKDIRLKMKIGKDKLYSVSQKYNQFRECFFNNEGVIEFGKNLTYDPKKYFFSKENEKVLNFIFENCDSYYGQIRIDNRDLKTFFKLLKNINFYIEKIGLMEGIKEELPFAIELFKENNNYILKTDITDNITELTDDYEYILYEKKVYKLDKELAKFIKEIIQEDIKELMFEENDLKEFSKGVLPIVKNHLTLSDELSNSNMFNKPDSKLYFDINKDNIIAKIILIYNNEEIDYFTKNTNIIRDVDYEAKIINELVKYGFKVENEKFVLNDLEQMVEFLDTGINELANLYNIYTSEKLKNTKLMKKLMITSTFSIGQDNILRYDFDLNGINENELASVFASLKEKKKYHKLKSGDIVSLEDDSLQELSELVNELDIDYKEASGQIPKYRAIYLDSLKKNKYKIIKTDNLFDNFIKNFKENKNAIVNFSKKDKEILRPYQITGVEWLYNIYKCDLGGILADEMGLGKSIQTIYFFKKLLVEDKEAKFLIVCPTALVYNWLNEFKKFGEDISVEVLVGEKEKRINKIVESKATVFITSYGTLREDSSLYEDKEFKVCVIDEAQNIKNPLAKNTRVVKKIKARTRIALTGTPIENSIVELWSIFDFIMPGFLSSLSKFNQKYKVKDMDEAAETLLSNLNLLTSPFILRRKKQEVATDLPDKIENNIYIDLGKTQRKLYAAEIKRVQEEMDKILAHESFTKAKFLILQLLTKLRQLCIDPRLVFENYKGESAKLENLIKVIKELIDNKHKILLFSSFKSAFDLIRPLFEQNDISYYTIDGSVPSKTRQELVDKFNNDETNVFLITLKSGGTGLNLTSADVVIHLDLWWNPQAENQATDRAHRIGQTKKVEVIKLISTGTIEEKILDLQKKKKVLSDKLIEKGENSSNLYELNETDIKNLLAFDNSL